ncbi:glycosyltransferase [Sphingobacterium sp. LRF_L2]|uniref:glycosyltransferase n=1 Tax=Sphingobacterium sp. LRF_L2 TaxID=3369421 RepID=UPI003F5F7DA3
MGIFSFLKKTKPTISFGITVCNEYNELKKLLTHLLKHISDRDEVIILQDITNEEDSVTALITAYGDRVKHIKAKLNGDFATFKNKLINESTGDYLFQIDADEIPSLTLLDNLIPFLQKNRKVDCFCVPRINIVNGITAAYLVKWNWTQNKDGYINFPDFQMRIIKLKQREIYWSNKVHEILVGYKKVMHLPHEDYTYCLYHEKDLEKQELQNHFYDQIT